MTQDHLNNHGKYLKIVLVAIFVVLFISHCQLSNKPQLDHFQETKLKLGTYVTIHCFYAKKIAIKEIIKEWLF